MGLLDFPAPLFDWIDHAMSGVPGGLRLVLWGTLSGAFSMWLYGALSPQQRIAQSKQEQMALRRRLDEFDGEVSEAWPMIRALLRLSFAQIGRVLLPSVVASLPLLCLLIWVSTVYGHAFPAGEAPPLQPTPSSITARWLDAGTGPPLLLVADPGSGWRTELTVAAPVTVVGRWRWWNALMGNPAGYLPPDGPADRVEIALPERQYLSVGPGWMRGWEFPFFASLVVISLVVKRVLRIQ